MSNKTVHVEGHMRGKPTRARTPKKKLKTPKKLWAEMYGKKKKKKK